MTTESEQFFLSLSTLTQSLSVIALCWSGCSVLYMQLILWTLDTSIFYGNGHTHIYKIVHTIVHNYLQSNIVNLLVYFCKLGGTLWKATQTSPYHALKHHQDPGRMKLGPCQQQCYLMHSADLIWLLPSKIVKPSWPVDVPIGWFLHN